MNIVVLGLWLVFIYAMLDDMFLIIGVQIATYIVLSVLRELYRAHRDNRKPFH